jgi:hypothetical protein
MLIRHFAVAAIVVCVLCSIARAQFANNTASFSIPPSTQALGVVNDNLQVGITSGGIVVFGIWSVTIPAGTQAGTLLNFEAQRLMQTAPYTPPLINSIGIPGSDYIIRPLGNQVAFGSATTSIDNFPIASAGFTFPNGPGPGQYYYNNYLGFFAQSSSFNYTGGANQYLRLSYSVDFKYSGAGGTYTLEFPLTATLVPEPSAAVIWTAMTVGLLLRRHRR